VPPPLPTFESRWGGRGPAIRRPQQCWGPPAISHAGILFTPRIARFWKAAIFFGWVEKVK
jgi:hypothetical protein